MVSSRRPRYAGRVIDGPLEGELREEEYPEFRIAIAPPLLVFGFRIQDPPEIVNTYEGLYIWSQSLRGWCFTWGVHPYRRF